MPLVCCTSIVLLQYWQVSHQFKIWRSCARDMMQITCTLFVGAVCSVESNALAQLMFGMLRLSISSILNGSCSRMVKQLGVTGETIEHSAFFKLPTNKGSLHGR